MYHHLRGILDSAGPGWAVVDCGGVGYRAGVSSNTYRSLPALGEKVKLLTHYVVREDAAELYGFLTQEELDCFRSMISVSGVGPKAALAILSELTPDRFASAVSAGDYKLLTLANGVGPKLAQRIVLELKGKLGDISELTGGDVPQVRGNKAEAAQALEALGMKPREAAAAVAPLDGDMTVEQLIAAALGKR
jgi:Holliday junction DNA helicase RuvA